MLLNPYLNWNEVFSYNCRHTFVVGNRGVGKTYGLTRWMLHKCIEEKKKFIWTRNTQEVLEEMIKFHGVGFLADHPQYLGYEIEAFSVVKGSLFYKDQLIGTFLPLSGFFKVKGINWDDYEYFVFDEFMPERGEVLRIDYGYALKSIMQSIFRKRTNFRAIYLANALLTTSNILEFFKFNIKPHFDNQTIQRNKHLSAIIFYFQNKDRVQDKIEGDAFAMANKYTESSVILDYKESLDPYCNKDIKKKELLMYTVTDSAYFLLREYKNKIAVIKVKGIATSNNLPVYALHKKFVFGEAVYDNKIKSSLVEMWNKGIFVFRTEYTLNQFMVGLLKQ